MRPADYDAKFNRVMQQEQQQQHSGQSAGNHHQPAKLRDTDKYNEINRLLNKKLSHERERKPRSRLEENPDDFEDSDQGSESHIPLQSVPQGPAPPLHHHHRKENLTDKQKFMEYTTKKQQLLKNYGAGEDQARYRQQQRYVEPTDHLPFEGVPPPSGGSSAAGHNKYAAVHRGTDLGQRTTERRHDRDSGDRIERVERRRDHEQREQILFVWGIKSRLGLTKNI